MKKELHDMKETSSGQNTTARYIGNTITTVTTTTTTAAAVSAPSPPTTNISTTTNKNNNCDVDHNKDLYSTSSPTRTH